MLGLIPQRITLVRVRPALMSRSGVTAGEPDGSPAVNLEIHMWTQFWDMNSGGGTKEPQSQIYIEAPEDEACRVFYNRFGHSPHRVSCTCCGADYSVSEEPTLREITGYQRNCDYVTDPSGKESCYFEPDVVSPKGWKVDPGYGDHVPLEDYVQQDDVLVIREDEIADHERMGEIPEQGYVWR